MFHSMHRRRKYSSVSTPPSLLYNQGGRSYQLDDRPLWGCGYHLNDTLHLCRTQSKTQVPLDFHSYWGVTAALCEEELTAAS